MLYLLELCGEGPKIKPKRVFQGIAEQPRAKLLHLGSFQPERLLHTSLIEMQLRVGSDRQQYGLAFAPFPVRAALRGLRRAAQTMLGQEQPREIAGVDRNGAP